MTFARNLLANRFARFLITGGVAAGVNVVSRYFLSTAMEYRWAVIVAYLCGMTTAWVLSRLFVFEETGRSRTAEYARFGLVNVVAAAQVWVVSVGLAEYVFPKLGFDWHPEDVAHVIGVVIPVFTSYLGHKHFSFAPLKPKT
ncbi:MAG: GtrA family protein [Rhodospirillaceae bacterium]|nr:GtrA family protein [Rhodospirillaceae bacterium]